jgi:hypothetical protein
LSKSETEKIINIDQESDWWGGIINFAKKYYLPNMGSKHEAQLSLPAELRNTEGFSRNSEINPPERVVFTGRHVKHPKTGATVTAKNKRSPDKLEYQGFTEEERPITPVHEDPPEQPWKFLFQPL